MAKLPSPCGEGAGEGPATPADAEPPPQPLPGGEGPVRTARPVTLAAVTGAHGIAGEVRLKLFGEGLGSLRKHSVFNDGALTLAKIRSDNKGGAIARFAEVPDRTAAEALRGTALSVPRDELPALADDEFYHSDMLDLPVETDAGEAVGRVGAVENFGATDIVEIERPDGKTFMVPLTEQAVPEWDERRLVVAEGFAQL